MILHRTRALKNVLRPRASAVDEIARRINTCHLAQKFLKVQYFNCSHKLREIEKNSKRVALRKERNNIRNRLKSSEGFHAA